MDCDKSMFSLGFHSFSQEAWGLLGIGGAATWKMGTDRDTTVQKK